MFKDIKKKAEEKASEVKEATKNVTDKVTDKAKNIGSGAAEITTSAVQNVAGVANNARKKAKNAVDSVIITMATKIIIKSMKSAGNKGTSYIYDDQKYEKLVGRTWEMLPLPIRLMGKDTIAYDKTMFTLRKVVFGKDKDEPKIDKQDEGIIKNTIRGMFK